MGGPAGTPPPPAPPRGQALPQSRARACTPLPTVGSGLGRDAPLPARLRLPKAGPPPNKGRDTPQGPRPPGPAPGPSTSPAAAGGGRQGALPVPGARDPFLSGAGRRSARRLRASAAVGGRAAPSGAGPGPGGGWTAVERRGRGSVLGGVEAMSDIRHSLLRRDALSAAKEVLYHLDIYFSSQLQSAPLPLVDKGPAELLEEFLFQVPKERGAPPKVGPDRRPVAGRGLESPNRVPGGWWRPRPGGEQGRPWGLTT